MQQLTINLIPLEINNATLQCSFYTEKFEGSYPLHRSELPCELWDNHKEEIKDKFYYTSFEIGQDAAFTTTIDLSKSTKFAKHFYTQQLLRYISPLVDAVKLNFVKDIEVWIKNTSLSKTEYTTYDKYTLKIEYSYLINSLALLIAYDGISKVVTQSINTFNIPTHHFKKVIFRNEILSFDKLHDEAKLYLNEVYPVLNIGLKNALGIAHTVDKSANRYKTYYQLINDFKKKYLSNSTLSFLKPSDNFYPIPTQKVYATHYHSNNLRFGKDKGIDPKVGIKKFGPYQPSPHQHVKFFFIYHQPDRQEYVVPLYEYFTKGFKGFFPPLAKHICQPFHMDKDTSLAYTNINTALVELKQHLIHFKKEPNTRYVAIYVSPVHKESEQDVQLYYQIKEELLKQDISSQVIYKESIKNNYFGAFLENITPALLAKIDGIPWRLDRELKQELIIGVGAFKSAQFNTRYVGSAFCFNNKGEFKGFDCFRNNEIDLIAGAIEKQVLKFVVDNNNQAQRLIIHYYKPLGKDELDPIQQTLKRLNLNIPIIIISINKTESSDYVAFDTNSSELMPMSGTILQISKLKYLLYNNTRYSEEGKPIAYPFPVKLALYCTDKDYLENVNNVKELIDQVYQFSRMYWKSVKQQNLPVTIKYPEMVAQIFPHFEGDKLPDFGKNNLWFL